MRVAPAVMLDAEQEKALSKLAHSRRASVRVAPRAQIILLAAQGMNNKAIAAELGIGRVQVAGWRERYLDKGVEGIMRDLPRGGRPVTVDVNRHVALTT